MIKSPIKIEDLRAAFDRAMASLERAAQTTHKNYASRIKAAVSRIRSQFDFAERVIVGTRAFQEKMKNNATVRERIGLLLRAYWYGFAVDVTTPAFAATRVAAAERGGKIVGTVELGKYGQRFSGDQNAVQTFQNVQKDIEPEVCASFKARMAQLPKSWQSDRECTLEGFGTAQQRLELLRRIANTGRDLELFSGSFPQECSTNLMGGNIAYCGWMGGIAYLIVALVFPEYIDAEFFVRVRTDMDVPQTKEVWEYLQMLQKINKSFEDISFAVRRDLNRLQNYDEVEAFLLWVSPQISGPYIQTINQLHYSNPSTIWLDRLNEMAKNLAAYAVQRRQVEGAQEDTSQGGVPCPKVSPIQCPAGYLAVPSFDQQARCVTGFKCVPQVSGGGRPYTPPPDSADIAWCKSTYAAFPDFRDRCILDIMNRQKEKEKVETGILGGGVGFGLAVLLAGGALLTYMLFRGKP